MRVCVFPHRLVCLFFLSRALSRALFRRPVSVRVRTGVFFFFLFFFVRIFFRSARMKTNEEKMHFVKSSKVVVLVIEKVVSRARSERARTITSNTFSLTKWTHASLYLTIRALLLALAISYQKKKKVIKGARASPTSRSPTVSSAAQT